MHLISTEDGSAVVSMTNHELVLLNNALNETLEAVDAEELQARVGASADQLRGLMAEVGAAAAAVD